MMNTTTWTAPGTGARVDELYLALIGQPWPIAVEAARKHLDEIVGRLTEEVGRTKATSARTNLIFKTDRRLTIVDVERIASVEICGCAECKGGRS